MWSWAVSEHKFGSNVVERALQRVEYSSKCKIVEELMGGMDVVTGIAGLKDLIKDEFGVSGEVRSAWRP